METMAEWFGLVEGQSDFSIENEADAKLFFARHQLNDQLLSILRRSFRTGNPPKMLLYGDWGVGKTHTMRHIEYEIGQNPDFNALVVFVEMPDIHANSTFQVAHAALLDALGIDRAKDWVLKFQTKYPTDSQQQIKAFTQSGDVAIGFANLLALGEGSRISWDWLRGLPLSAGDSKLVGLPPKVDQSTLFVQILRMLGRLCEEIEEQMLIFMLDEARKLDYATKPDATNHWLNAIKLISDPQTKELGFIVSGSWVDPDEMAPPLSDQQVLTRFGEQNVIPLPNLDEDETKEFVSALLMTWVDPRKRQPIVQAQTADTDGEEVADESFPFTVPALEMAISYICRDGGISTPRDIQKKLDDIFNRAMDDNKHILSSSYLSQLING